VLSMKNNSQVAMEPLHDINPLTHLWKGLTTSQVVIHCILEYIELLKVVVV